MGIGDGTAYERIICRGGRSPVPLTKGPGRYQCLWLRIMSGVGVQSIPQHERRARVADLLLSLATLTHRPLAF